MVSEQRGSLYTWEKKQTTIVLLCENRVSMIALVLEFLKSTSEHTHTHTQTQKQ